jgi:chromosome partitioning protein
VSRSQKELEAEITKSGTKRFRTALAERQAYKAMFNQRLALTELANVGNLDGAIANATTLANELVETLVSTLADNKEVA